MCKLPFPTVTINSSKAVAFEAHSMSIKIAFCIDKKGRLLFCKPPFLRTIVVL